MRTDLQVTAGQWGNSGTAIPAEELWQGQTTSFGTAADFDTEPTAGSVTYIIEAGPPGAFVISWNHPFIDPSTLEVAPPGAFLFTVSCVPTSGDPEVRVVLEPPG
jgi:hypothetical protein